MPVQKIPLWAADEKQSDAPGDYARQQMNGLWTQGTVGGEGVLLWQARPGRAEWVDLGEAAAVDGLHWWTRQEVIAAVCNGKTFFVTADGTVNEKTGTATLVSDVRPTFADVSGSNLFAANSGQIGKFPSGAANDGAYLADVDAPTTVSHIATNNLTLIALRTNSERFDWANTNAPDVWDGNWATAQEQTDLARALHVSGGRLLVLGENTLERWYDDGTSFVKELSGSVPSGTLAPHTFTVVRGRPYWLDNTRQVVTLDGVQPTVLSDPYARYFQALGTVNDALGDFVALDGSELLLLTFPTDGKTVAYDTILKRWSEWGSWSGAAYGQYDAKAICQAPKWGTTVCGDSAGKLYQVSNAYTDDDGAEIRPLLRTSFVDRGTEVPKFCRKLVVRMKRTEPESTPATVTIRYRDDGAKEWKATRTVTVEATGTTDLFGVLHQLGSYRSRQWEVTFDAATRAALVSIEEEFDYGR